MLGSGQYFKDSGVPLAVIRSLSFLVAVSSLVVHGPDIEQSSFFPFTVLYCKAFLLLLNLL